MNLTVNWQNLLMILPADKTISIVIVNKPHPDYRKPGGRYRYQMSILVGDEVLANDGCVSAKSEDTLLIGTCVIANSIGNERPSEPDVDIADWMREDIEIPSREDGYTIWRRHTRKP